MNAGGGQVVINKNITLEGAGINSTTILADFDTVNDGGSGRAMILVNAACKAFNVSGLTIDGD